MLMLTLQWMEYTTLVLVVLANQFSAKNVCLFVLVFVDVYIAMDGHATPVPANPFSAQNVCLSNSFEDT